ncbi:hypothetical protein BD410DRAFT_549366 [Rickenella mellea]|uniref:F-box domain-containing protein n=1 Tax=Rickenella mellea TaxID=50990 RepID=A0A4Y7PSD8_9AGAM|nr:hypothetical protein BD410DRAFT_549366 [Rickenella mellea]
MPVLLDISIIFECEMSKSTVQQVFSGIISMAKDCPMLERFAIGFTGIPTLQTNVLRALAFSLPSLREVNISGPGLCFHEHRNPDKPPSWRVLRVDDCNSKDYSKILKMVKFMKESGECWEAFQLHISGWQIPEELKRFLGNKLQY